MYHLCPAIAVDAGSRTQCVEGYRTGVEGMSSAAMGIQRGLWEEEGGD